MDGHEQKWVPELWVISTLTAVIIFCSVTVTQVHYHPLPTDCKSSIAPRSLPNNIIQPAEEAELRTYQTNLKQQRSRITNWDRESQEGIAAHHAAALLTVTPAIGRHALL